MNTALTHIEIEKQQARPEFGRRVPALRFKGYEGKWNFFKLEEIVNKKISYGIVQAGVHIDGGMPYIKSKDINGPIKLDTLERTSDEIAKKYIRSEVTPGDIIFSLRGNIGISQILPDSIKVANLTQGTARISVSKNFANYFIYQSLHTLPVIKRILCVSKGSTFQEISLADLRNVKIVSPNLPEQQKIASFLSAVDEKIQQLTKKKALLERYKKGVMQQLFSGQLRFKDENGNPYPDWKPRKMSEVLFEHKLNSTGNEEVFSVSVHKGLVNQVEHLGRVFAAKNTDNYNLVQPGDIVYTKSPTGSFPLGIIKQSKVDENVIVSPLYGIFTPETEGLGYIFNVFFESPINVKNYLASIIQKGAKNTINITNTTFLSKKMKLPVSKKEQNRIGDFLKEIDGKISKTNNQITQTQTFKKGLLQQMFI
ncbi:type I restriction enzyme S subunit [Gillisia mitskevichiae]|uniref:Type I restriction enzyme S subunit n=1 Tax=Gillisia mitskevichiae TaxID=270921 RepID=A0A495PVJ4_9FLAO|nr:restriction endonuclease subunit S [Gillisia mitskevichiae]RKS53800.1 type I restriction enzyme S subunit [Gillisia mitskevichiae]